MTDLEAALITLAIITAVIALSTMVMWRSRFDDAPTNATLPRNSGSDSR